MKFIMLAAATCLVLAGCAQPSGPPTVRETSGPAVNPTGSNGPMSGQPENTNSAAGTTIVRGTALNPTGSRRAGERPAVEHEHFSRRRLHDSAAAHPTGSAGYQR